MTEPLAGFRGWAAVRVGVLAVLLAGLFALVTPVPAAAHVAGSSGSPTNYEATVTGIRPAAPGVDASVGLGGQWVRLTNQGADEVVVLGYWNEPFLRLTGDQVQINEASATAVDSGLVDPPPADAPPTGPRWVTDREGNQITWADERLDPPSDADQVSWELPLVVDGRQVAVLGTLDRVPPPSPWPWVAALALVTAAVSALGWKRDWHRPMAVAVTVGVLAFALHLLGTGLAPQSTGPVFAWAGLGAVGAFALVVGAVAVVSLMRRSRSAADRVVVAGIIVLLLAATDISVLWHSQLPFAGPAVLDRVLTALTYGVALGLLVAGARLTRRVDQARPAPGAAGG